MSTKQNLLFVAIGLLPFVKAHGQVHSVSVGGTSNAGPNVYYSGDKKNSGTATRVMYQSSGKAFNLPSDYSSASAMACEGASGAPTSLKVNAGESITVFWEGATGELKGQGGVSSYNPFVHATGPILDYITSCNGDCSKFDASSAGWTKIAEYGIDLNNGISDSLRTAMTNKPEKYYPTSGNGRWALAKLIEDGSKWTINIPKTLKNGQYIVRNELAAMHDPLTSSGSNGPQHYVACVQVEVTNGGSASLPAGTNAGKLYSASGDFAKFNIYSDKMSSFKTPGPAVWDGASSGSSNDNSGSSNNSGSDDSKDNSNDGKSDNTTVTPTTSTKASTPAKTSSKAATPATQVAVAAPAASSSTRCKNRKRSVSKRSQHRRRLGVEH